MSVNPDLVNSTALWVDENIRTHGSRRGSGLVPLTSMFYSPPFYEIESVFDPNPVKHITRSKGLAGAVLEDREVD